MRPSVTLFASAVSIAVIFAFGQIACDDIQYGDEKDPIANPNGRPGDDDDSTGGELTWNGFAKDFNERYCIECHGTPLANDAEFPLETYSEWVEKGDDIEAEVVIFDNMPNEDASAFPTDEERAKLGEWIAAGMPE